MTIKYDKILGKLREDDGAGPGAVTTSGGTANRVARFTGATTIGNGSMDDDGARVLVIPGVDFLISNGQRIDSELTGGPDTLNLGTSNADVINIGWSGAVVNVQGTLSYQNVTNLQVTDKLVTFNKGGGIASGNSSGFEIEENGIITGWVTTTGGRNGYEFKAPSISFTASYLHDNLTANRSYTLPDANGVIVLGSITTNFIPKQSSTPGVYQDSSIYQVPVTNNIGIGTITPAGWFHVLNAGGLASHFRAGSTAVPLILDITARNVGIGIAGSSLAALRISSAGLATSRALYIDGINSGVGIFIPSGSTDMNLFDVGTFSGTGNFNACQIRIQTTGNFGVDQLALDSWANGSFAPGPGLGSSLAFRLGTAALVLPTVVHGKIRTLWHTGITDSRMAFHVFSAATLTERMSLLGDGSLGLGTTTPTAVLDVSASTATRASVRIRTGVAPTTPNVGDVWFDGTNYFVSNGATRQIAICLTASAVLDFPSIPIISGSNLTITVTDAALGDCVALGVPAGSVSAGLIFTAWVSAVNTVTVRCSNVSAAPIDPASGTYKVTVFKNI